MKNEPKIVWTPRPTSVTRERGRIFVAERAEAGMSPTPEDGGGDADADEDQGRAEQEAVFEPDLRTEPLEQARRAPGNASDA